MKKLLIAIIVICATGCATYKEPDWFNASYEEIMDGVIDDQLIPVWGVVISKDFEGGADGNDNYTIECCGQVYNGIIADDLDEGEEVTVYFAENQPVRVLAGWR